VTVFSLYTFTSTIAYFVVLDAGSKWIFVQLALLMDMHKLLEKM